MKKKLLSAIGAMMLLSCVINASCDACVTVSADRQSYTVDGSGCVDY